MRRNFAGLEEGQTVSFGPQLTHMEIRVTCDAFLVKLTFFLLSMLCVKVQIVMRIALLLLLLHFCVKTVSTS